MRISDVAELRRRGHALAVLKLGSILQRLGWPGTLNREVDAFPGEYSLPRALRKRREARLLGKLARIYTESGQSTRAIEYHERWLSAACETGDRHTESVALGSLAGVHAALENCQKALELYQQALDIRNKFYRWRAEANELRSIPPGLLERTQDRIRLDATKPVNYYLTVTGLDMIKISSVGDIEAPDLQAGQFSITIASTGDLEMGNLEADTLTVRISSTGDVTMDLLNADTLEVDIGSIGNLDIAGGQVKTQKVTISSSGKYTAQDLASDDADVRLSSNGSATIWVQDHLKAKLTSSGDLRYRGNPTVDATTDSSGDVIQIGE